MARLGFAARATLYLCLGFTACRVVYGAAVRPDFPGTLQQLAAAFGSAVVFMLAVGFGGYAVWRWNEAIKNPEHRRVWQRVDIATRGCLHGWSASICSHRSFGRTRAWQSSGPAGWGCWRAQPSRPWWPWRYSASPS